MKKYYLFFFLFLSLSVSGYAQFAPQAGLAGSTAISATSGQFVGWATTCTVKRGYMNIADSTLGYASAGDSSLALGPADDITVSLGDSGVADLTFANPIYNGNGPDFAVFENGFRNDTDSSVAFLELAFVEVSSDGIHYFRFRSTSLTQTQAQIGNGDYMNAVSVNNLAGKYIATYGTPFDLEEMAGTKGLDINNVTHVRLIDVVGSIREHASHDNEGLIVNDPYPTPFPSCGFDLDAVGVIYEEHVSVKQLADNVSVKVYPNPATDNIVVDVKGTTQGALFASLTTITGNVVMQTSLSPAQNTISVSEYPAGMYFLVLADSNGNKWTEKIIKR